MLEIAWLGHGSFQFRLNSGKIILPLGKPL
jgi:hypothetical protein